MSEPTIFRFWFKGDKQAMTSYTVLRELGLSIKEILQKTPPTGEIQYELMIQLIRLPAPPEEFYKDEPLSRDVGIADFEEAGAARFWEALDTHDDEEEEED